MTTNQLSTTQISLTDLRMEFCTVGGTNMEPCRFQMGKGTYVTLMFLEAESVNKWEKHKNEKWQSQLKLRLLYTLFTPQPHVFFEKILRQASLKSSYIVNFFNLWLIAIYCDGKWDPTFLFKYSKRMVNLSQTSPSYSCDYCRHMCTATWSQVQILNCCISWYITCKISLNQILLHNNSSRYNLIIWMRSSSVRNKLCPMCGERPNLVPTYGEGDGFTQENLEVCGVV